MVRGPVPTHWPLGLVGMAHREPWCWEGVHSGVPPTCVAVGSHSPEATSVWEGGQHGLRSPLAPHSPPPQPEPDRLAAAGCGLADQIPIH